MKSRRIRLIFDQLGKQAFPDDTDPWTSIQTRLATEQAMMKPGQVSDQPPRSQVLSRPLVPRIAFALLIIISIFMLSPGRQALAETLRHLFWPTSKEQFPPLTSQQLATPTFAPTFAATLASAQNPKPTETLVPVPTNLSPDLISACGIDPYGYACKIARAEKQAGFDAKEFPADPEGFVFRAVEKAISGEVWIRYNVIGGGGYLYWSQGIGEFPEFTGAAPESAIEEVQVGENRGEYVAGIYGSGNVLPAEYTWSSCCRQRLRWTDGERWYELDKQAALPQTDYMTREAMIQMATQMVDQPSPTQSLRADYLTSLTEASQLTEFEILAPSILPDGFRFDYASYDKDLSQLRLTYTPGGTQGSEPGAASILIIETPLDKLSLAPGVIGEELKGETVNINGYPGTYFSDNPYDHWLTWRTSSLKITLMVYSTKELYGGSFTKEQILEMGKSMK
ncbi:MAG: hypothetical protein A2X25_02900 [Chloroflexi bacterium GWB2_49_20]|nr:MAG: hypothetical protein A2X25_02900 [Chloroflexi bacterium GWB2_49_20]OGN78751.1 MAG: hypothetical protein A2X26_12880 [Chloroflexi bacterium GWC2_49_37]OGN85879.1 MAG: hypothetical protein A2X27_11805 [Chloroflexi bacterium GWD2_49_16]